MARPFDDLTEAQRRQIREAHAEATVRFTSETPCPQCGCLPGDAWGCGCSNEDCPCSEEEDRP